jgi:hypothetical protein
MIKDINKNYNNMRHIQLILDGTIDAIYEPPGEERTILHISDYTKSKPIQIIYENKDKNHPAATKNIEVGKYVTVVGSISTNNTNHEFDFDIRAEVVKEGRMKLKPKISNIRLREEIDFKEKEEFRLISECGRCGYLNKDYKRNYTTEEVEGQKHTYDDNGTCPKCDALLYIRPIYSRYGLLKRETTTDKKTGKYKLSVGPAKKLDESYKSKQIIELREERSKGVKYKPLESFHIELSEDDVIQLLHLEKDSKELEKFCKKYDSFSYAELTHRHLYIVVKKDGDYYDSINHGASRSIKESYHYIYIDDVSKFKKVKPDETGKLLFKVDLYDEPDPKDKSNEDNNDNDPSEVTKEKPKDKVKNPEKVNIKIPKQCNKCGEKMKKSRKVMNDEKLELDEYYFCPHLLKKIPEHGRLEGCPLAAGRVIISEDMNSENIVSNIFTKIKNKFTKN